MRHNYIGGTSATGGVGTLTLTASDGLALPSNAFIDTQTIEYSIIEFTDATLATIKQAESGFGAVSATNVLTRSAPRETWVVAGSAFIQAAAAALTFGTANIRVYVAPIAEGGATSIMARANFSGALAYGPNEYMIGSNLADTGDYSAIALSANVLYIVPIRIESGFPITSMGVSVTVAAAATSVLSVCIAATDPTTGNPGTILLAANGLAVDSTGIKTASVIGRIIAPGWYWACVSSNGAPTIYGSVTTTPNPIGGFVSSASRIVRYVLKTRTHANFTAGSQALAGATGSATATVNSAAPILLWR